MSQTTATPASGIEFPGDTVTLTLTLSEAVTVTGTPVLALNNGGTATYSGGSGSTALTFSYTVGASDGTVSALAITAVNLLNGATITDAAGNAANLAGALTTFAGLQIDPPPPAPTIASFSTDSGVVGDHLTNDNTLTLTGTAAVGSTVKVYDGANLLGSATADGSGLWSYTTAALANGSHSFTATATDTAGVTGAASSAMAVTIDTTAPVAATIGAFSTDSGVVGDGITNDNTLALSGTAEAGSIVKVYDGATLLGSATANGSGAWTYTTAALANGGHSFTATATDAAGNTGVASNALAVTVDTTAPIVPVITSNTTDSTKTIALAGTAEANSTVKIYEGALLLGSVAANGTGAWAYTTAPLSDGVHTLTATATDAAGNTSLASQAVNPIVGPTTGMTTIEANGSTSLMESTTGHFYLYGSGGTGPSLKYGGTDFIDGQFTSGWKPIGVEKTATGYQVAWKIPNQDKYTVWNTDSNGNYVSSIGTVTGGSATLQSAETSFHQDLNGDGVIGPVTTPTPTHDND